jgi:hypothetical protein
MTTTKARTDWKQTVFYLGDAVTLNVRCVGSHTPH